MPLLVRPLHTQSACDRKEGSAPARAPHARGPPRLLQPGANGGHVAGGERARGRKRGCRAVRVVPVARLALLADRRQHLAAGRVRQPPALLARRALRRQLLLPARRDAPRVAGPPLDCALPVALSHAAAAARPAARREKGRQAAARPRAGTCRRQRAACWAARRPARRPGCRARRRPARRSARGGCGTRPPGGPGSRARRGTCSARPLPAGRRAVGGQSARTGSRAPRPRTWCGVLLLLCERLTRLPPRDEAPRFGHAGGRRRARLGPRRSRPAAARRTRPPGGSAGSSRACRRRACPARCASRGAPATPRPPAPARPPRPPALRSPPAWPRPRPRALQTQTRPRSPRAQPALRCRPPPSPARRLARPARRRAP